MSGAKLKITLSVLVIICSVSYLVYDGFRNTMVYYLTVSELETLPADELAARGGRFRVSGAVVENSIVREPGGDLNFFIEDGENRLAVSYKGIVPDTFREGVEAVVEGAYERPGFFHADILLAKCPTKYESADDLYSGE